MCVFASEWDASVIAVWMFTPARASAVLYARRNEWKSTRRDTFVSK